MKRHALILILLLVLAFSLAAWVQPRLVRTAGGRDADNAFKVLFGEGRRMFANHFAVKADVYLHSGFYPSIFDQAAAAEKAEKAEQPAESIGAAHVHTPECDHDHDAHDGHEGGHEGETTTPGGHQCDTGFMKQPLDWFEAMGRHFMVTEHSHLAGGREREILPWLKLSAELDPQREETYTVAGFWLAERMNKPGEAEEFLRQGLRANPQSYEILFELGKVYQRYLNLPDRARGVWQLGLRRWDEVESRKEKPDTMARLRLLEFLAQLELDQGNPALAIRYFEAAKKDSPDPAALDVRIAEIRKKLPR